MLIEMHCMSGVIFEDIRMGKVHDTPITIPLDSLLLFLKRMRKSICSAFTFVRQSAMFRLLSYHASTWVSNADIQVICARCACCKTHDMIA